MWWNIFCHYTNHFWLKRIQHLRPEQYSEYQQSAILYKGQRRSKSKAQINICRLIKKTWEKSEYKQQLPHLKYKYYNMAWRVEIKYKSLGTENFPDQNILSLHILIKRYFFN